MAGALVAGAVPDAPEEVVLEVALLGEWQFFGEAEGLDLDPPEDEAVAAAQEGHDSDSLEIAGSSAEELDLDSPEAGAAAVDEEGSNASPRGRQAHTGQPPRLHCSSLVAISACEMLFLPRTSAQLSEQSRLEVRRFAAGHLSDCEVAADVRAQYEWEVQKQEIVREALGVRVKPVERKRGQKPSLEWAAAPREALRRDLFYNRTAAYGEERSARIAAGIARAMEQMARQPPLPLRSELVEAAMRSAQPAVKPGAHGMRSSASLPSLPSRQACCTGLTTTTLPPPISFSGGGLGTAPGRERHAADYRERGDLSPMRVAAGCTSALPQLGGVHPPVLPSAARVGMRKSVSSSLLVSHNGARAYAAHRDPISALVPIRQLPQLASQPLLRPSPERFDAPPRAFFDATEEGCAPGPPVGASSVAFDGGLPRKRRQGARAAGKKVSVVGRGVGGSRTAQALT
jgi:hypothetical protein